MTIHIMHRGGGEHPIGRQRCCWWSPNASYVALASFRSFVLGRRHFGDIVPGGVCPGARQALEAAFANRLHLGRRLNVSHFSPGNAKDVSPQLTL